MLKRILVVDDDPAVRSLLEIVGRRAGFAVDTAVDGLDALEKLRANDYVIVILDLMMPRVNGYDVVQQLRSEPRRPAIVVVTAMTGAFVSDLDPQIVQSIIRKPFDVEMMAAVLTDLAEAMTSTPAADAEPAPVPMPRTRPEAQKI